MRTGVLTQAVHVGVRLRRSWGQRALGHDPTERPTLRTFHPLTGRHLPWATPILVGRSGRSRLEREWLARPNMQLGRVTAARGVRVRRSPRSDTRSGLTPVSAQPMVNACSTTEPPFPNSRGLFWTSA